jgi:hypothetical protein
LLICGAIYFIFPRNYGGSAKITDLPKRPDKWVDAIRLKNDSKTYYIGKTTVFGIGTKKELQGLHAVSVGDEVNGVKINAIQCRFFASDATYANEQFMWRGQWGCQAGRSKYEIEHAVEENGSKNFDYIYIAPVAIDESGSKTVGPVQSLTPAEFLKLPDDFRALYVGGLIEGMAFISYGYSLPDHEEWTACVRQKSIGDTTDDVVSFLKGHPDFNESIASALAQVMGKRCKH